MKAQDIVRGVIKITGNTYKTVVEKSGMKWESNISMLLKSNGMRLDRLIKVLDACGYELIARSKEGGYPEFVFDAASNEHESYRMKPKAAADGEDE